MARTDGATALPLRRAFRKASRPGHAKAICCRSRIRVSDNAFGGGRMIWSPVVLLTARIFACREEFPRDPCSRENRRAGTRGCATRRTRIFAERKKFLFSSASIRGLPAGVLRVPFSRGDLGSRFRLWVKPALGIPKFIFSEKVRAGPAFRTPHRRISKYTRSSDSRRRRKPHVSATRIEPWFSRRLEAVRIETPPLQRAEEIMFRTASDA
jgi:hypothetical protein